MLITAIMVDQASLYAMGIRLNQLYRYTLTGAQLRKGR